VGKVFLVQRTEMVGNHVAHPTTTTQGNHKKLPDEDFRQSS
jgi:hypothetical protein